MFVNGFSDKRLRNIKVALISKNPSQPRKYFDPRGIEELAESILQYGILNPLTVRKSDRGYELIAGERRLRAARQAGLREVPCIVMQAGEEDSSAIALVENLQRKDLDFFEEAWGYRRLIDSYGLTQEEAAQKVGKTQSAVANKLRLLKLSPRNMQIIRENGLTERHARSILRLDSDELRIEATYYIIKHQLNVSRSEPYIDRLLDEDATQTNRVNSMVRFIKDVRFFLNTIDKAVLTMRESGVNAKVEKEQHPDGILLKIQIPNSKSQAC